MWGTIKNWPRQRRSPGSLLLLKGEILGIRIFFPCRCAGSRTAQPIALWGGCSCRLLGLRMQRRESLHLLGASFIPASLSPAADSAGSAPEARLGTQWLPPLLSSWHPCMAYGTPAWHMAALLSSWHICTVLAPLHGICPRCPAPGRILPQPQCEGGREGGRKGLCPSHLPQTPQLGPASLRAQHQPTPPAFPHPVSFLGESYINGSSAGSRARAGTFLITSPGPLGASQPPLGPGDLEVALLVGSAAVRRLNSAPVLGI